MVTNILWKDYMAKYYDFAVQRASNCFKRKKGSSAFWDNRIEEENVVRDAAIDALQNVYTKYDPDKVALESYLSRAVHNEVVDKLEKEMKCLSMVKDITLEQEKEYTLDDLASSVSSAVMLNMKERLENAMKELKPVDQVILASQFLRRQGRGGTGHSPWACERAQDPRYRDAVQTDGKVRRGLRRIRILQAALQQFCYCIYAAGGCGPSGGTVQESSLSGL